MFFAAPGAGRAQILSGCMSEYDVHDPTNLIIAYTQAFLLPTLWIDKPSAAYVIGFAGGRVPLVLHHFWPDLRVESTDIDPAVRNLASGFFGVAYDHRQTLVIEDGRKYLEILPAHRKYDFILVDAFRGTGFGPLHLATAEFYDVCKRRLVPGGVVATNFVSSDSLLLERINTIRTCFKHVYVHFDPSFIETYVVLGTDGESLDAAQRNERAASIQSRCEFKFPWLKRAVDLRPLCEQKSHLERFGRTDDVLSDGKMPEALLDIPKSDPLFYKVGRNDLCPCGSGKKFKKCHGR
jgi:spermidine synthase